MKFLQKGYVVICFQISIFDTIGNNPFVAGKVSDRL